MLILTIVKILKMDKELLHDLLSASYESTIDIDKAWSLYNNFDDLCINGDFTTIIYMYKICMMKDFHKWFKEEQF